MSQRRFALAIAATALAHSWGCQHNGESTGTTTIRSGTPGGVRVTSTPAPATTAKAGASKDLARALCARQRQCAMNEGVDVSSEAALLDEALCVADAEPQARLNVESWRCSPAVARAGLEECLAAIRSEMRCTPISLTEVSAIRDCRPSEICRKGAGLGQP